VLNVGRRTRTIPPALRRALEVRDGGCRHPGCGSRFTDTHHIEHWADGGETRLENLVLLCRRHHRAVHEGRVRVCRGADDAVAFVGPGGRVLYDAPRRAAGSSAGSPGGWPASRGEASREDSSRGEAGERSGRGLRRNRSSPRSAAWGGAAVGHEGPGSTGTPRLDLPAHRTGAARWARDRDVPWAIEALALEGIEAAAGW
jgi:hypothetical protein